MSSSSTWVPGWLLEHGLHDLGIAFFAHVQKNSSTSNNGGGRSSGILDLQLRLTSAAISDDGDPCTSADSALTTIEAARQSVQKALDCQTFIVSLFTQDVARLCCNLRRLGAPLTRDVNAMIAAAGKDDDARLARDFRSRLDSVTLAYEPLIKRMITAVERNTSAFPSIALRDAAKAETQANLLYLWARTHVPMDTNTPTKTDKAAKLRLIPYIVAMAYAVRVKLDVHYVETSGVNRAERLEYLERSRTVVDEFIKIVEVAVLVTIHESSLVDMAMDYNVALTTYVTLMKAMRATAQVALKPKDRLKPIAPWDDGLSGIRAIFCEKVDDASSTPASTTALDSVEEIVMWAQFVGYDLKALKLKDLKDAVHLQELIYLLGANLDDESTASIRLAPDCKRALFDLPSANCLRIALQVKITEAIAISRSHPVITSLARTRNATQLATAHLPAVPSAPLNPPRLVHTFTGRAFCISAIAVSSDGQRIVLDSDDRTAKVWSATTGQTVRALAGHHDFVKCVALFSDNSRAVTATDDSILRIWNINTGTLIRRFDGHECPVNRVAVSPDDCTVASASDDMTIKLWSVDRGQCIATLYGHTGAVRCVVWSTDEQVLASGSDDMTVKVWRARDHSLLRSIDQGHSDSVSGVAFAGDLLVSCSDDKTIKVWKWQTKTLQTTLSGRTNEVWCVAVFPDNERVVSGGDDNTVRIWNLRSGLCEHTLKGHTSFLNSVAVSRDGQTLVSGSWDGAVKVWTLRK